MSNDRRCYVGVNPIIPLAVIYSLMNDLLVAHPGYGESEVIDTALMEHSSRTRFHQSGPRNRWLVGITRCDARCSLVTTTDAD